MSAAQARGGPIAYVYDDERSRRLGAEALAPDAHTAVVVELADDLAVRGSAVRVSRRIVALEEKAGARGLRLVLALDRIRLSPDALRRALALCEHVFRVRGSGPLERVTWDEALVELAPPVAMGRLVHDAANPAAAISAALSVLAAHATEERLRSGFEPAIAAEVESALATARAGAQRLNAALRAAHERLNGAGASPPAAEVVTVAAGASSAIGAPPPAKPRPR